MTSKLIALLILLVLPCMGATITTVDDTHTNLPPNAVTTNETSDVNFQGGFALGGKAFPTNPAAGAMMRYDGTNWLATSGYEMRPTNQVPIYSSLWDYTTTNFTFNTNYNTKDLPSFVPAGVKAVDVYVLAQNTTVARSFFLCPAGAGNPARVSRISSSAQVAGIGAPANGSVPLEGTNRFFYYYSDLLGTDDSTRVVTIYIKGWWY